MKLLAALAISFLVTAANASETRVFTKTSATTATVTISGKDIENQAANYIDNEEFEQFVTMMMADPQSPLAKLVKSIEQEYCNETAEVPGGYIGACGSIHFSKSVVTSFGRGGWMSAAATHSFFVGFRSDGTGRFLESSHLVHVNESVEAQVDKDFEFTGVMIKTYSQPSITDLSK